MNVQCHFNMHNIYIHIPSFLFNSGQKSILYFSHFERNFATFWINGYIFSQKLFLYFLGRLSNEMQSTFNKTLTNTFKKLFEKVATKWTFILLCKANIKGFNEDRNLCPDFCSRLYVVKDKQHHQQWLHLRCSKKRGQSDCFNIGLTGNGLDILFYMMEILEINLEYIYTHFL